MVKGKGRVAGKMLSLLVVLSFVCSGICYALPGTLMSAASKDHMALASFLQNGTVSTTDQASINKGKNDFATMLYMLTKSKYQENNENDQTVKEITDYMWEKAANETGKTTEDKVNHLRDLLAKLNLKIDSTDQGIRISSTENDNELYVEADNNGENPRFHEQLFASGQSGKAQTKAAHESMEKEFIANSRQATTEEKAAAMQDVRDIVNENVAAGNYTEAEGKALIAAAESRGLRFSQPVVVDENNYQHGASTVSDTIVDENLTGRELADLIIHETLESKNGFDDKKTLEAQTKLYGLTEETRKDTNNQMGKTRQAMAESRSKVKAAAQKTSLDVDKSLMSADEDNPEAQETAVAKAKEAGVSDELIAKAGPKGTLSIVKTLMTQALNAIRTGYKALLAGMPQNLLPANKATQDDVVNALKAALQKENAFVGYSASVSAVEAKSGELVPSSLIAPLVEPLMTAKDKALTIYGLTDAQYSAFEKCIAELEAVYEGISKKIVLSKNGVKELKSTVGDNGLSVVCLQGEEQKIDGVNYVEINPTDLAANKINALNVFIYATSLSQQGQEILKNLTDEGIRSVKNLEIADETQYKQFQEDYNKFVSLFTKA